MLGNSFQSIHCREGGEKKRTEAAYAVPCGTWRSGYEVGADEDGEDQGIDEWLINEGSGQVWLFFGNQNPKEDWIFQEVSNSSKTSSKNVKLLLPVYFFL